MAGTEGRKIRGTSELHRLVSRPSKAGKSYLEVQTLVRDKTYSSGAGSFGDRMPTPHNAVEVTSSFARERTLVLGSRGELVLAFDRNGKAWCPTHLLPILRTEMRSRPGRFCIPEVADEAPHLYPAAGVEIDETLVALSKEVRTLVDEARKFLREKESTNG